MTSITCSACGVSLPANGTFCPACGALRPPSGLPVSNVKTQGFSAEGEAAISQEMSLEDQMLDDEGEYGPGEIVLDYRLERKLGAGGMGSVWLARHRLSEQAVAVKILPSGLARDREVRERFLQEAKALGALDHPSIVPLINFSSKANEHFLVMKFVDGESVQDRLNRLETGMAYDDIRRITRDVLEALAYAHKNGIIHRDIKPANVMIADDDRTYLADFGIARQEGGAKLTQTGMLMGTPHYMAPEQIAGGAVTARTDLYGTGLLVYEMCTGSPPFDAEKTFAILKAHLESPVPLPETRRADPVPHDLMTLMSTLLQKEPKNRPESAQAALDLLAHPETVPPMPSPFTPVDDKGSGSAPTVTPSTKSLAPTPEGPVDNLGPLDMTEGAGVATDTPASLNVREVDPMALMSETNDRRPMAIALVAVLGLLLVAGAIVFVITRPPPEVPKPDQLEIAKDHMLHGRHSQAIELLKPLRDDDHAVEVGLLLARAELSRGEPAAALVALDKVPAAAISVVDAKKLADLRADAKKALDDKVSGPKGVTPKNGSELVPDGPKKPKPKPKPKPRPRFDELSDKQISEVAGRANVPVRNCFQTHLTDAQNKRSTVSMAFTVSVKNNGRVRFAKFRQGKSSVKNAALAKCLQRTVFSWRFPAFKQPELVFDHTFAFKPSR